MAAEDGSRRYWAFISYSHADEAWAQWLHRALETYRVPRHLVGRSLGDETIPRRLYPVFRDRDELPSSHELGAVINRALAASRNLVVVCSPRAATSRWVNEEIRAFRALGRGDRVFCLIVDGEPHASAKPEIAFSECFPPALRSEGFEPIAADARERKDGKAGARLKLLAGLLGVGLDELKQREKQRQRRRFLLNVAAGLALVAVLGGTVQWFLAQRAAREREIRIEQLVENGRLELLDGHQARAAVYLNEARKLGADSVPVRFMLGQAMQPVEAMTGVQVVHGGERVYGAAFSPDGTRFVLIVSPKENVAAAQVYEATTGRRLAEFADAPPIPQVIQFLPDDSLLVSGYSDTDYRRPITRIWRSGKLAPATSLDGFNGITGLAVSPDGRSVLVTGAAGARIHDTGTGLLRREMRIGGGATAASFSPDGEAIAVAAADGTVEVRDARSLTARHRLGELKGQALAGVTFTPDGSRLLAISSLGDVRIWSREGALQLSFAADLDEVFQLAFDRTGRRLITAGREGFKIWSLARGNLLLSRQTQLVRAASAFLSPDGDAAYFCDVLSNTVDVWDVLGKRRLFALDHHTASVTSIALDGAGKHLLVASADGRAEIWRSRVRPRWEYRSFDRYPYIAHFEKPADTVLVGEGTHSAGDSIRLSAADGSPMAAALPHPSLVTDVDAGSDGDLFATASADGHARVWRADGTPLLDLPHDPFAVTGVQVGAAGARLLTTGRDAKAQKDTARLWSIPDGRLLAEFDHSLGIPQVRYDRSARFDPTGERVLTANAAHELRIWSARDGKPLLTWVAHDEAIVSAEFSPDGREILSAGLDNRVRVWDAATGGLRHELADAALGQPTRAAWSADASQVAISSRNGNLTLWVRSTGEIKTLKGHNQWVVAPLYAHHGALLISYGFDGTAMAWDPESARNLGIVAMTLGEMISAEVDPSETVLLTSSWGQISLWDIRLESRGGTEVAERLRCTAPWALDSASMSLKQVETPLTCAATP